MKRHFTPLGPACRPRSFFPRPDDAVTGAALLPTPAEARAWWHGAQADWHV